LNLIGFVQLGCLFSFLTVFCAPLESTNADLDFFITNYFLFYCLLISALFMLDFLLDSFDGFLESAYMLSNKSSISFLRFSPSIFSIIYISFWVIFNFLLDGGKD